MVHSLSKEEYLQEIIKSEREINNWFINLTYDEKNRIFNMFESIFEQINCKHEWFETTMYDEPILSCKCGLIKKILK
jgi:hypothetical protein